MPEKEVVLRAVRTLGSFQRILQTVEDTFKQFRDPRDRYNALARKHGERNVPSWDEECNHLWRSRATAEMTKRIFLSVYNRGHRSISEITLKRNLALARRVVSKMQSHS